MDGSAWSRGPYVEGDLAGADLAFVATAAREVNLAVTREARARGVWINAADDPAHCTFILPAVVRRGDLTVAVATGGTSPALSAPSARARGLLHRGVHDARRARGRGPGASCARPVGP